MESVPLSARRVASSQIITHAAIAFAMLLLGGAIALAITRADALLLDLARLGLCF